MAVALLRTRIRHRIILDAVEGFIAPGSSSGDLPRQIVQLTTFSAVRSKFYFPALVYSEVTFLRHRAKEMFLQLRSRVRFSPEAAKNILITHKLKIQKLKRMRAGGNCL